MGEFAKEHRKVLLERIDHNVQRLEELKQKDISSYDDWNKEHIAKTIKNLESDIEWHRETVKLIDEGKIQ